MRDDASHLFASDSAVQHLNAKSGRLRKIRLDRSGPLTRGGCDFAASELNDVRVNVTVKQSDRHVSALQVAENVLLRCVGGRLNGQAQHREWRLRRGRRVLPEMR